MSRERVRIAAMAYRVIIVVVLVAIVARCCAPALDADLQCGHLSTLEREIQPIAMHWGPGDAAINAIRSDCRGDIYEANIDTSTRVIADFAIDSLAKRIDALVCRARSSARRLLTLHPLMLAGATNAAQAYDDVQLTLVLMNLEANFAASMRAAVFACYGEFYFEEVAGVTSWYIPSINFIVLQFSEATWERLLAHEVAHSVLDYVGVSWCDFAIESFAETIAWESYIESASKAALLTGDGVLLLSSVQEHAQKICIGLDAARSHAALQQYALGGDRIAVYVAGPIYMCAMLQLESGQSEALRLFLKDPDDAISFVMRSEDAGREFAGYCAMMTDSPVAAARGAIDVMRRDTVVNY